MSDILALAAILSICILTILATAIRRGENILDTIAAQPNSKSVVKPQEEPEFLQSEQVAFAESVGRRHDINLLENFALYLVRRNEESYLLQEEKEGEENSPADYSAREIETELFRLMKHRNSNLNS